MYMKKTKSVYIYVYILNPQMSFVTNDHGTTH
jgi:hypothetical protein